MERALNWLKRRADNNVVTYSRFGLPGDEIDERPPPTKIYVSAFNDDAPEFRLFYTHISRAALLSCVFGLSATMFSFIMFMFEYNWKGHESGSDVGTILFSVIFLAVGMLVHMQAIKGLKVNEPRHMLPAIMVYTFMVICEVLLYMLAASHVISAGLIFVDRGVVPSFFTASVCYFAVVLIQVAMLITYCKASIYMDKKNMHAKEVKMAEQGKRQNPGLTIVYAGKDDVISPRTDIDHPAEPTMNSPPPRVILAAHDEIA